MPQNFTFRDYKCEVSAGYPVAFSTEQQNPTFVEELTATGKLPIGIGINSDDFRRAADENMTNTPDSTFPNFSGKAVLVYLIGGTNADSTLMTDVKLEAHAGKVFITGKMTNIGGTRNWTRGMAAGIAWDRVERYMVWDSEELYWQRFQEYRKDYPPSPQSDS